MIRPRLPCEIAVVIVAAPPAGSPTQAGQSAPTPPRTGSGLVFAEKDPSASGLGKEVAYPEIESPNGTQQILVINSDPTDRGILPHSASVVRLPGRMRQLQSRARAGKHQAYAQGCCVGPDAEGLCLRVRDGKIKMSPNPFRSADASEPGGGWATKGREMDVRAAGISHGI
jgi:hypothetical protein